MQPSPLERRLVPVFRAIVARRWWIVAAYVVAVPFALQLALGVGNRVNILEHAVYSVISPEGCAAILWKDQARAEDAARALRLTAKDLKELGVIDEILVEPPGGAHMDHTAMAKTVSTAVRRHQCMRKPAQYWLISAVGIPVSTHSTIT